MKTLAFAMALVCLPALYAEMERAANRAEEVMDERFGIERYLETVAPRED